MNYDRKVDGKVYLITNNINGKQYVGVTTLDVKIRFAQHRSIVRSGCPLLKKAIKKYGVSSFSFDVIDFAGTLSELDRKEIEWIETTGSFKPKGYNMTRGGLTNEAAIESLKTPVLCLDNGVTYKSLKDAAEALGVKTYSISMVLSGRQDFTGGLRFEYVDPILKEKTKIKKDKRWAKTSNRYPHIRHVETGLIFKSASLAADHFGVPRIDANNCCRGVTDSARGVVFEYVDDKKREFAKKRRLKTTSKPGFKPRHSPYTETECRASVVGFKLISEFENACPGQLGAIKRLGLHKELCGGLTRKKRFLTDEEIQKIASYYKTKISFKQGDMSAYNTARARNILKQICTHMRGSKEWTRESAVEESTKYKTRSEFKLHASGAYKCAVKIGILDSLFLYYGLEINENNGILKRRHKNG